MNDAQLENLLEEALSSVQENAPNIVNSIQTQSWLRPILGDVSNIYNFDLSRNMTIPILNILHDLSMNIASEDISNITDLSNNNVIEPTTQSTINSNTNQDYISQMALINMASDYQYNHRLYQQNITQLLRHFPNGRPNRRNSPSFLRRDIPLPVPSFITSMSDRLLNRPTGQMTFEFQASPGNILEPHVPTLEQYTNSTDVFIFNSETLSRVSSTTCPITLEDFHDGELLCEIRHCHHIFKETALRNWFIRNTHCPVCRYDIRTHSRETI